MIGGKISDLIIGEPRSYERFRKESTRAALTTCRQTGRLMIMQIEKHNVNVYPAFPILMTLDIFKHSYFLH
ncbi:MAG: hypothetical protein QXX99_02200 [Candidatus Bathyarchaeia archaeon]